MTDPTVSVVIVAWKAREDALRCLGSLREHAGVPYEAIVVDDGSEDGTPEAVRAAFPEATVLARRPNAGLVAGRNAALPHVRGTYVLMLDADTEVRPARSRCSWGRSSATTASGSSRRASSTPTARCSSRAGASRRSSSRSCAAARTRACTTTRRCTAGT